MKIELSNTMIKRNNLSNTFEKITCIFKQNTWNLLMSSKCTLKASSTLKIEIHWQLL